MYIRTIAENIPKMLEATVAFAVDYVGFNDLGVWTSGTATYYVLEKGGLHFILRYDTDTNGPFTLSLRYESPPYSFNWASADVNGFWSYQITQQTNFYLFTDGEAVFGVSKHSTGYVNFGFGKLIDKINLSGGEFILGGSGRIRLYNDPPTMTSADFKNVTISNITLGTTGEYLKVIFYPFVYTIANNGVAGTSPNIRISRQTSHAAEDIIDDKWIVFPYSSGYQIFYSKG